MKKYVFSAFVMCFLCMAGKAYAEAAYCRVTSCPDGGIDSCTIPSEGVSSHTYCREYIRATVGGRECYSCDSNDYGIGTDQCPYKKWVGQADATGNLVGIYECVDVAGAWDLWRPAGSAHLCSNSPLKNSDPQGNSNKYYLLEGSKSEATDTGGDHVVIPAGHNSCVYYVCKEGYAPSADKTSCVVTNGGCPKASGQNAVTGEVRIAECELYFGKTGGLVSLDHVIIGDPYKCQGTCTASGWDITLKGDNSCNSADYVADASKKKCVESQASIDRRNRQARDRRNAENQRNADACTQTGGQWANNRCVCDAAAHLEPLVQNKTCKCMSGYDFENGRCVITNAQARKEACERSSEATWNEITKTCVCNNPDPTFTFNYNTLRCEQDPRYIACIGASNTEWVNGGCHCTKTGYEWNGTKCVEGEDLVHQREENARKQRIAGVRANITSAAKKLDDIMSGLKVSVWKTSEGTFNTSRLASDSIAGVVLGTAGGLITSHLVKKGQVKAGFEDIQCTVGGQKVADWGDEFTVGIQ